MDTAPRSTSTLIWPYFSHSAMMLKLQTFEKMYEDDSLWEIKPSGKVFSREGRIALQNIWNGLFCLGTVFPENIFWKMEYLNAFIFTVKKLCAFSGMSRCFKNESEIHERRKLVFEFWKSLKEHEVYKYTSHRDDTLSIQAVLITVLLKNLKGNEELQQPPLNIGTHVHMSKDEIQKLNSEIEELIEKN